MDSVDEKQLTEMESLQARHAMLIEAVQTQRLRREIASLEHITYREAYDGVVISQDDIAKETGWNQASGNMTRINAASDRHRGAYRPFFDSEQQLAQARAIGRYLAQCDETGSTIVGAYEDYTVGDGSTFSVQPRDNKTGEAMADELQALLDKFVEANKLSGIFERAAIRETLPDGESWLLLRDHSDGIPRVRLRTGEHFTEPRDADRIESYYGPETFGDNSIDWSFGVATPAGDYENVIGYFAQWYGVPDSWEFVPAERAVHIKLNTPADVKRGISDFFSTYKSIIRAGKGFNAANEGATLQATIAYIEKVAPGTSQSQIESSIATPATFAAMKGGTQGTFPVRYEQFATGRRIVTDHDWAYGPMGAPQGAKLIDVFQATLRRVGARYRFPEFVISGDASNNNMASSVTAGSALHLSARGRQIFWSAHYVELCWKALALMGVDVEAAKEQVRIEVAGAAMVAQNELEAERIRQIQKDSGVLSVKTWRSQVNLDNDEEEANIEAEPKPEPMPMPGNVNLTGKGKDNPIEKNDERKTESIAIRAIELLLSESQEKIKCQPDTLTSV